MKTIFHKLKPLIPKHLVTILKGIFPVKQTPFKHSIIMYVSIISKNHLIKLE